MNIPYPTLIRFVRLRFMAALCITFCCMQLACNGANRISRILRSASFSPTVPSDAEVVKLLGPGAVLERNGDRFRTYYNSTNKLWLRCQANLDDKVNVPVMEVLISKIPLGAMKNTETAVAIKGSIRGLSIGDSENASIHMFGKPLRTFRTTLGNAKGLNVLEFFPKFLEEENGRIRVFADGGKIVAISVATVD